MPDERWEKVQSLFTAALLHPAGERVGFLDRACGQNRGLRQEVESLLEHDTMAPAEFLKPPTPARPCVIIEPDSFIGTQIGQYEIKRVIGSGGMGTVYEAEQQRPKRLVALKVVKADLPSRSLLRRLEYESEVLARLQHPHIAQIFEAGTHCDNHGRTLPYFAMEYIDGAQPITTFVAKNKLGTRDRLALFLQACEAVHHGHQKGIIHRDLKPANILVDSRGQVKVIDFGVARATDSDVAVTTMQTNIGSLIGTLQYMSPEQCEADPHEIDIRSDVYSLGVVLYELLTGELPYDVRGRPIPSATRAICESEPRPPSTIDRKLRGDLEIIVLTAIDKDRVKRYESAGALAADLQCYLQHEPISARPRSTWTKAVHWAGRHPRIATAIVSLVIALGIIGGTATATWYLNFEPRQVILAEDRSAADLIGASGRRLHTWGSVPDGLRAIRTLIPGHPTLAVIGFAYEDTGPYRNALCAYDIDASYNRPLWRGVIHANDLPAILTSERGFKEREFFVNLIETADIFHDQPGTEIIAIHKHVGVTSSALRIYSPQGIVLYQVWLDVDVKAVYWLSEAQQLVVAGFNGRGFWRDRDRAEGGVHHPCVVFALRPQAGMRSTDYVRENPGQESLEPAWYQGVGKREVRGMIRKIDLRDPVGADHLGRYVRLWLVVANQIAEGGCEVLIDSNGHEVPGSERPSDHFAIPEYEFPPASSFALQDLPPTQIDIPYGSATSRGVGALPGGGNP